MKALDEAVRDDGTAILTRAAILQAGGTDQMISARLRRASWTHPHPGVYLWGPPTGDWLERLGTAVAAAGPQAVVSHRAAFVLWRLDGLEAHLIELTVPYECGPTPADVIRHRTRRPMPRASIQGLPVTTVERTLLDVSTQVPTLVVAKGMDTALRRKLTSVDRLIDLVATQGGRGVRGAGKYRTALQELMVTGPVGSPAEVELRVEMVRHGIPDPTPQWEVQTRHGRTYRVDFGWPPLGKGIEIDGLDAHASAANLERDLNRQNDLLDAGVQLRRFSARTVRRSPAQVCDEIARFLRS